MDHSLLFLLGFILIKTNHINTTEEPRKFTGKRVTDRSQFPYQAAVIFNDIKLLVCDGAIIHKRFVLTAAHCCYDADKDLRPVSDLRVKVGNKEMFGEIHNPSYHVKSMIVYDEYDIQNEENMENDISLLEISKGFRHWTNDIRPINLRMIPTLYGNCFVSAFLFGDEVYFSGAPLVCSNELVGLIIGGYECSGEKNLTNTYTDLFQFLDWINSHIPDDTLTITDSTPPSSAERKISSLFSLIMTIVPWLRIF